MPYLPLKKIPVLFFCAAHLLMGRVHCFGQLYQKAELLTRQLGLSDNRITCVFKDRTGYMWIGTKSGLNLYDGHDITVFNPGPGNSISNEMINGITEDKDGKLWVATMNGLNCYDPVTKNWQAYFAAGSAASKTIPNPVIWSCFADADNRIWISTDRNGPSVLEKDRTTFTHFKWRQYVHEKRPDLKGKYFSIIKMIPAGDDGIYLGSTIGVFKMSKRSGLFTWLGEANRFDVLDMQYDATNGKLYMTTGGKEVYVYDEKDDGYSLLRAKPLPYPSLSFSSVMAGPVCMGFPDGLAIAGNEPNKITLLKHHPDVPGSIPGEGVNTVYRDNTGIMWIATNKGLAKYDLNHQYTSFLPLIEMQGRPAANPMGAVYYDKQSDSYFVCSVETGEVFIVDRKSENIISQKTDAAGKKLGSCLVVKPDRENQLWLLTASHVYRYDRATRQFVYFATPNGHSEVMFRDMVQDADGNYWFAGFHSPLYFYDNRKKAFTHPSDTSVFSDISKVNSLLYDSLNQSVWAGTFNHGLYRYSLLTRKFTLFTEAPAAKQYSFLNLVNHLYQDKNGRVWVSTHAGGLFYYVPSQTYERSWVQVSTKEGLATNNIYAVSGNDSLLYAMSGKGITVLDSRTGALVEELNENRILLFTSFSSDEHLPHYTAYDNKRNELLVAAGGGLMIYKTAYTATKSDFPVLLTSVMVNNKPIADINWRYQTNSVFSYPLTEMRIGFAALYYTAASSVQYQYMLEGYDKEWRNAVNINEVIYQNLPPGNYTFRLQVKDFTGYQSASKPSFSFVVVPPFWKTGWFRALAVLLAVCIVYLWIRRLRRRIWTEQKLNRVATSLFGKNTVQDVLQQVAAVCITELGFSECNVYQYVETAGVMESLSNGTGIRSGQTGESKGEAIVNEVAKNKEAVKWNTGNQLSEIAVPVMADGNLFGVIHAQHPKSNFFKGHHINLLIKMAGVCAEKISRYNAEEKLRSKIARDLHDEMGSTLTSINIISKVAMAQTGNDDILTAHLEKIKNNSAKMMDSMSDMVWAINPANDTFEKVALRMKEFAAEILEPAGISYYFREVGEMDKIILNPGQRKDVYLVFKEVLNNAVKYSHATEVDILLQKEDEVVVMNVVDNGNGFDINDHKQGNGLKNMHSRARQLNAELVIHSVKGTGTSILLKVPLTS